jgi:quercetin dioxygenase-like cupin family protein
MIDSNVYTIKAGSVIIFPQGAIHMVRNSGKTDMKLICFFTSPVSLADYKFHEDISFPEY